jgi:hypothetical protein
MSKRRRLPNYLARVLKMSDLDPTPAGVVRHVHVYHDVWCAVWRGGLCDCDPEVRVVDRPSPSARKGEGVEHEQDE